MKSLVETLLLAFALQSTAAGQVWVDADAGDDANDGSNSKPLASIEAGLAKLKPGMTLHVLPGEKPWPGDIRITVSGTKEAPIVVDGHGSIVSNRRVVGASEWKDEGGGVFSRKLPNNAWGMATHWEGGFPLAWFAGKAGENVTTRDQLKPSAYFLHKNQKELKTDPLHNTLFIQLPEDKTPSEIEVETIAGESGIFVGGDHVTVRNFVTEYGGRDGFATHRNTGVIFENIEARYFMDQGMSHHGATDVIVRNAHFHHNAGAGIVDVYPEAKVRYENCLIENDTWRGGVEFHKGEFEMVNCVIRGNPKHSLTVTKGARATLKNCRIEPATGAAGHAVNLSKDSHLQLNGCTIRQAGIAVNAVVSAESQLVIRDCDFEKNDTAIRLTTVQKSGEVPTDLKRVVIMSGCQVDNPRFEITRKIQKSDGSGWSVKTETYEGERMEEFLEDIGSGPD